MLLRSILSKVHNQKHFATFCSLECVQTSLLKKPDKGDEKSYVISYLVNRCGLSPEMAVDASNKVRFDSPEKPNAVLEFLSNHGFTKSQTTEIVSKYPTFLRWDPDKTFLPKINYFLHEKGLSKAETCTIVTKNPRLLTVSLGNRLIPICNYLEDIIGPVKLRKLMKYGSQIFCQDLESDMIPNTQLLKELGVPSPCLKLIFSLRPEIFGLKHDKFKDIAGEVKQMGFDVSKTRFVLAMDARSFKGQTVWNKCYETYRRWGWSEDDIYMAFRKHPKCMVMSEKKISLVLDFVVNELDRDSRSIAHYPTIMLYNLEKRIAPRCSVAQMLCSKGLIKKNWSLSSVICPSENCFLDRFVMRYVENIPQLYDLYKVKAGVVS